MKLKPIHYFLGGVALTALVAAARFAGGTPLDQTFTYQGQLRNAGQLVSGPVDLRITLWNSDTAGSQIGDANTFDAMRLTDGRFACGLSFGTAAFDGSNRWIQVEFRNPAGSGEYQALSPRDKITATPYALYALNAAEAVQHAEAAATSAMSAQESAAVALASSAAASDAASLAQYLAAKSAQRCDAILALSYETRELAEVARTTAASIRALGINSQLSFGAGETRAFTIEQPCQLLLNCTAKLRCRGGFIGTAMLLELDRVKIPIAEIPSEGFILGFGSACVPLDPGLHELRVSVGAQWRGEVSITAIAVPAPLN